MLKQAWRQWPTMKNKQWQNIFQTINGKKIQLKIITAHFWVTGLISPTLYPTLYIS